MHKTPSSLHAEGAAGGGGAGGRELAGAKVVVVGIGNSALDIALEAADAGTAEVHVACRTGALMLPIATRGGWPRDVLLNSRLFQYSLPGKARAAWFGLTLRSVNKAFRAAGLPAPPEGIPGHQVRFSNLKEERRCTDRM